jgi:prepilin peptidase CpaA
MWTAFILAFSLTAAAGDLVSRKIPLLLTTAGLGIGLGYHLVHGGFGAALLAAGLGFAVGLPLFALGAIGGGDVKLIAALGALLGFQRWLLAMEVAIFAAGLLALLIVIRHRRLTATLKNMKEIALWLASAGKHPQPVREDKSQAWGAPFGVAAALATWIVVLGL